MSKKQLFARLNNSKAFYKCFIKDYTGFKHTVTFKELKMYQFETCFKI